MTTFAHDVMWLMQISLDLLGLVVDGPTRRSVEYGCQKISLRNRSGVRVVLELTDELLDDAVDGIDLVSTVERSRVLNMLADAQESRTLGVRTSGDVFERASRFAQP